MTKLKLTIIMLCATLHLSSCGSTSTNPIETVQNINQFNNKAAIFIIRGVSGTICESTLFVTPLTKALTGVITQQGSKSITCNDFGRKSDRTSCYLEDYTVKPGNLACIIGYNDVKENPLDQPILATSITGTILDIFIRLAE